MRVDLTMPSAPSDGSRLSLLLHDEALRVTRRQVAGDTVRVETVTGERQQLVDTTLTHDHVDIEHVPIGRVIDRMPDIRTEGDLTVIPVVEEVVVVERRLVLKEEIHMRRVRVSERHQQTVTLRHQEALVTRVHPGSGQDDRTASPSPDNHEETPHD
ncbi:DUF2382 domain-containing protein [Lichenicoccus sp.]|uniref:DUF2382 domain-containing protein n=1 Tax=Lichenicoccus sp. TaxID=2781899 RepID=UPI003D112962